MPVSGKIPIMEVMFRITCELIQPKIPAIINLGVISLELYIILKILLNIPNIKNSIISVPMNPNISPMIANIESLIASGR